MTSSIPAALTRLVLGWAFVGAGLWWVFSVEPGTRVMFTLLNREFTTADLPALPLLVAGVLLSVLAVVGRRARRATVATVLLFLSGVTGWVAVWWLAIEPAGGGAVFPPLTPAPGITVSDSVVIATTVMAAVCGLGGLVELARSAVPVESAYVDRDEGADSSFALATFFRSED